MRTFYIMILLKIISDVEATPPKSENLALETVMEFGNKNTTADLIILDNVQNFLNTLKNVLDANHTSRRSGNEKNNIRFAEFVKQAIEILKTYNDNDLEDVFDVFDDEIRKYHYRGCKFHEVLRDQNLRRFVGNQLSDIKYKPAVQLRESLGKVEQIIDDAKFDRRKMQFIEYVNSLYRTDSTDKLKTLLENLQSYAIKSKRANLDLIQIVRNGLRSIIFDHISELNPHVRNEFKTKLESIWSNIAHRNKEKHQEWTVTYPEFSLYHVENTKYAAADYVRAKKHKSNLKKHAAYISLYPEEITINKYKEFKNKNTRKAKHYTLREEYVINKRKQKKDESLSSEDEINDETAEHTLISEHKSVINVDRAPKHNKKHSYETKRDIRKLTTKQLKRRRPRITNKKSKRKQKQKRFMEKDRRESFGSLSEEGMSIERFDDVRRSMFKTDNITPLPDDLKVNVLRRINNLEKEMEEVKHKIGTTTVTVNINSLNETEFEPLEFWKGTSSNKIKNNSSTTTSKRSIRKTHKIVTTKTTHKETTRKSHKKAITRTSQKMATAKTSHKITTEIPKTVEDNIDHINETTQSMPSFRSLDSDDVVTSNKSLNLTDTDSQMNDAINDDSTVIRDEIKDMPVTIPDHLTEASTKDEDLDNILKKYNMSNALHSTDANDFNKYLEGGVQKPSDIIDERTKSLIENDLKKLGEMTSGKPEVENDIVDPFAGIDPDLDLI